MDIAQRLFAMKILFIVFIFFLAAWFWYKNTLWLANQIAITCSEKSWPRNWVLLALVPFIGNIIYKRVLDATNQHITFRTTPKKDSKFAYDFVYEPSDWILLEEQYDLKTSDHHGTRIHSLNRDYRYQIITQADIPDTRTRDANPFHIQVGTPRPVKYGREWARLDFNDITNNWDITNLSSDTVIPIVDSNNSQHIKHCLRTHSLSINCGETFIISSSDFKIICLPPLAVYWYYKNKHYSASWIKSDLRCGSAQDNSIPIKLASVAKYHWMIKQDKLICHEKIDYSPVGSEDIIHLDKGTVMKISLGDTFKIPRVSIDFFVDYEKAG